MVMTLHVWRPVFSSIPRHFQVSPSRIQSVGPWNDGVQPTARPVPICRLAAVALCALLVAGSSRCAPQSTTPDSHSADTQSDKPREGGQAPAVGGVNTGGAHRRYSTASAVPSPPRFRQERPILFEDIARQAGLTTWKHVMGTPEKNSLSKLMAQAWA